MIVFYRTPACPGCDEVAERLREAVVAHRIVELDPTEPVPGASAEASPPVLVEGKAVAEGLPAIHAYLDELARELQQSRMVSGDACYIDPKSPGACF